MNTLLPEIYRRIYGSDFSYDDFECRKNLQKAVYLLENMGVSVGDYSFSWDNYGPYSLSLDCEASHAECARSFSFPFSQFAEVCFDKLKEVVSQHGDYDCSSWMECVASLHYLKNVLRWNDDHIIGELVSRKPYLSDDEANKRALKVAGTISVGV